MRLTQLREPVSLRRQLVELRPRIAKAVQGIYDEWQQDDKTLEHEELGEVGISDQITEAINNIVSEALSDTEVDDYEKDDHIAVIAERDGESYTIDIPTHLYDRGMGTRHVKIQGIRFMREDISINPL